MRNWIDRYVNEIVSLVILVLMIVSLVAARIEPGIGAVGGYGSAGAEPATGAAAESERRW